MHMPFVMRTCLTLHHYYTIVNVRHSLSYIVSPFKFSVLMVWLAWNLVNPFTSMCTYDIEA